ncbi:MULTISPECIES: hypothetical protein [Streptacidiphilus]|uniref:Integral membrane protein n=1 Tax=Streptacidiphilus cavernicola TaxID=3342716 RepID=A0ABV6UP78_9ACTN|nr:hypothetical protein [Streptacidiphilus jeojiense]
MHTLLASSPNLHTNLAAGISTISGVTPNWGPFSKLGSTATIILGVIAAAVLVTLAGVFLVGLGKSKGWLGEGGHSTMESSRGKGMMVGGLVGIFLIASFGTLVTIVYGMGV